MLSQNILKSKNFLIYGLGLTGQSVCQFLKKSRTKNIFLWDDNRNLRKKFKIKENSRVLKKKINEADFIILSPGISLRKSKYKKTLLKNKNKVITDIDLFFLTKKFFKSIIVTGTNGKSTTCSIIKRVLESSGHNIVAAGNIGKPILDYNFQRNTIAVIEMSSFQLEYSKYLRPNYAILLNISKDHLDWHGTMKNYINAKFKIFSYQKTNDFAYVFDDQRIINLYKRRKFKASLLIVKKNIKQFIKNKIKNNYLKSSNNVENLSFIYLLMKKFKIADKFFFSSLKKFQGLPHRQEVFLKKNKISFINDSKATSFEASKSCLTNYKNIIWILGGLKKDGDRFFLNRIKKNIIKAFIIGKDRSFFKKQLRGKIDYKETLNLKNTVKHIYQELKFISFKKKKERIFVIFSPASASYDQFNNFEERGNQFKKLTINYARKYF